MNVIPYDGCDVILRMWCHMIHVRSSKECELRWFVWRHLMNLTCSEECNVNWSILCHLMHKMSCELCDIMWCLQCHLIHLTSIESYDVTLCMNRRFKICDENLDGLGQLFKIWFYIFLHQQFLLFSSILDNISTLNWSPIKSLREKKVFKNL